MLLQKPLVHAQRLWSWIAGAAAPASSDLTASTARFDGSSIPPSLALFGDSLPWNTSDGVTWVSVDDRVRGGSSVSHLEPYAHRGGRVQAARFFGTLDTKTLGGAGFASVATEYAGDDPADASLDLSAYDGILLRFVAGDQRKYTFIVKDEVPERRADGRARSVVSYEADFYSGPFHAGDVDGGDDEDNSSAMAAGEVEELPGTPNCELSSGYFQRCLSWAAFKATYRGRPVKDPKPLDTSAIKSFSIMIRSFFDKQHGEFELILHSVWAFKRRGESRLIATSSPIDGGDDGTSKPHL